MREYRAKKTRKAARKLAELQLRILEGQAGKWRQLPWWKRLWLRIKWMFTSELKGRAL